MAAIDASDLNSLETFVMFIFFLGGVNSRWLGPGVLIFLVVFNGRWLVFLLYFDLFCFGSWKIWKWGWYCVVLCVVQIYATCLARWLYIF